MATEMAAATGSRTDFLHQHAMRVAYGIERIHEHVRILRRHGEALAERGESAEAERWRRVADEILSGVFDATVDVAER